VWRFLVLVFGELFGGNKKAPERGVSIVTQCGSAGNKRMDPIAYTMGINWNAPQYWGVYGHTNFKPFGV
jgi:hypothetical protein